MILEIALGLAVLLLYLYYKLSKNKNHWSERGVPNTGFKFFWGNDKEWLNRKKSMHDVAKEEYFKFAGKPFYGGWSMLGQPYLMIRNDFELIRSIWIKDFDHFDQTRGHDMVENMWVSSRAEKMAVAHVGNLRGEEWKDIRSTFTPIFSSGRLKQMLPLLQEINGKIKEHIKVESKMDKEIELKDLMGKFSMDALASCAFGVDSGSFSKGQDSEFQKQVKVIFDFGIVQLIQSIVSMITLKPIKKFFHALGFKNFATIANLSAFTFFQNVVEASIKQRKESKSRRNDLVDLMIDALEGKLDEPKEGSEIKLENKHKREDIDKKSKDISYDSAISTAGILLVAGYDTTGTTMSYALYELAINQDCQDTLFEEIENAKEKGKLTYDAIQSLPYLDAVIHETLRRHPVVAALERPCSKDYKLPGTDLIIKKGEIVRMNTIGIFFDPDIYPNPEQWNPENFSKENRAERNPYSFAAFSLGPRNCLAMRFAIFEMKVAISDIVSNFKLVPTSKTNRNLRIDPKSVLGAAEGGLWIKFEER